jgi:pyrimidine deaminase RibD-like protein
MIAVRRRDLTRCANAAVLVADRRQPFDQQTLERTTARCRHYFKDAPCLKRLIKLEDRQYRAVCGKKDEVPAIKLD